MNKIQIGMLMGIVVGIIDVVPLIFQKYSLNYNLSVLAFWIVAGFFISTTELKLSGIVKEITISLILLVPLAFIIGWQEPTSLIPIAIITAILGALLGYSVEILGG